MIDKTSYRQIFDSKIEDTIALGERVVSFVYKSTIQIEMDKSRA